MNIKGGLESECEWIDNHPERYKGKEHQELVKQNIAIRYRCNKMIASIDSMLQDDVIKSLW